MDEIRQPSWKTVGQLWWAQFWRLFLIYTALGVGFFVLIATSIIPSGIVVGVLQQGKVLGILGFVFNILLQLWVLRSALSDRYKSFKIDIATVNH